MAEAIGVAASVLTITGLFKGCVEAFELIRTIKSQDVELKKLTLKLSIEKCRLVIWGESMGFSDDADRNVNVLADCAFRDVVVNTLQLIHQLLTDSDELSRKYGCLGIHQNLLEEADIAESDSETPADKLNMAFSQFKCNLIHNATSHKMKNATCWIIRDRKQFKLLVSDTKDLIDGLQDITKDVASRRQQDRAMTSRIITINDQGTLNMISEVCESDHPAFSDAASCRADVISISPTQLDGIADWSARVEGESSTTALFTAMEDWTVAEYRQNFLDLLERRKQPSRLLDSNACSKCRNVFASDEELKQHGREEECFCMHCLASFDCRVQLLEHYCFSGLVSFDPDATRSANAKQIIAESYDDRDEARGRRLAKAIPKLENLQLSSPNIKLDDTNQVQDFRFKNRRVDFDPVRDQLGREVLRHGTRPSGASGMRQPISTVNTKLYRALVRCCDTGIIVVTLMMGLCST